MEEVNDVLYESKLIGYVPPYNDKVRTFCQNPGGFVSQENYEGGLAVVNGHSFKDKKSKNTNVAILSSHHFRVPFDQPIEYARKVGELTNMLGNGQILVHRLLTAASDSKLRQDMNVEDEYFSAIETRAADATFSLRPVAPACIQD